MPTFAFVHGACFVGGCGGGPEVIDLENRTYWTC